MWVLEIRVEVGCIAAPAQFEERIKRSKTRPTGDDEMDKKVGKSVELYQISPRARKSR